MRTIDGDALYDGYLDTMKKLIKSTNNENNGAEAISLLCGSKLITDAPTIQPKTAKWIKLTGMAPPEYHGHKICSVCESFAPYDPLHPWREMLTPYCPGCGAEMEGIDRYVFDEVDRRQGVKTFADILRQETSGRALTAI